MHTADGSSCKRASDPNTPPRDLLIGSDGDEGGKEHEDGHKEGQSSKAARVGDLQLRVSIPNVNCSISDIMHTPNRNTTHSYGRGD